MNQLFVRPNQNSILYQMISYSYYYFTAGDVNLDQSSALGFFFFFFLSWLIVAQNALFVVLKRGTGFRNLLIKVRVFLELGEDENGV